MDWNIQPTDWEDCYAGIFEPDANSYVAVVLAGPDSEAYTNLIAAAPDLLAGAEEAVAAWDMEADTPDWNHEDRLEAAIAMLRAAIAKAKGQD